MHSAIVTATEASSKMASMHCQNGKKSFCQKAQNFVNFGPYTFVQISLACSPNMCQIMYGKTLDFQPHHF